MLLQNLALKYSILTYLRFIIVFVTFWSVFSYVLLAFYYPKNIYQIMTVILVLYLI